VFVFSLVICFYLLGTSLLHLSVDWGSLIGCCQGARATNGVRTSQVRRGIVYRFQEH